MSAPRWGAASMMKRVVGERSSPRVRCSASLSDSTPHWPWAPLNTWTGIEQRARSPTKFAWKDSSSSAGGGSSAGARETIGCSCSEKYRRSAFGPASVMSTASSGDGGALASIFRSCGACDSSSAASCSGVTEASLQLRCTPTTSSPPGTSPGGMVLSWRTCRSGKQRSSSSQPMSRPSSPAPSGRD